MLRKIAEKVGWYVLGIGASFLTFVLVGVGVILLFLTKWPIACFGSLDRKRSSPEIRWKRWLALAGFVVSLLLMPIWLPLALLAITFSLVGLFVMGAANDIGEWLFSQLYMQACKEEWGGTERTNLSLFFPLLD